MFKVIFVRLLVSTSNDFRKLIRRTRLQSNDENSLNKFVFRITTDNTRQPESKRPSPPLLHNSDDARPEIPRPQRPQRPQTAQTINQQGKLSIT